MNIDIDAFQNLILIAVAIGGVLIAWWGLSTWKKQLHGVHEFELARRILLSVYKIEDGVKNVRSPFLDSRESGDSDGDNWETSAYMNRWEPVEEAFRELRVDLLEADVLWGREVLSEQKTLLRKHLNTLRFAIENKLTDISHNGQLAFTDEDFKILYSRSNDEYAEGLAKIVNRFDGIIGPKLSRYSKR